MKPFRGAALRIDRDVVFTNSQGQFFVRKKKAPSGRLGPVNGLRVRLRELSRESITDQDGTYLFRDLPAGSYTIVATYQGREFTREVILPASPAFLRAIDIYLSLQ